MTTPWNALRVILQHTLVDLDQCVKGFEEIARDDPAFFKQEVREQASDTAVKLSTLASRISKIAK